MNSQDRMNATRFVWGGFVALMAILLMTAMFTGEGLSIGVVILSVSFSILSLVVTGFIWNWGDLPMSTDEREKSEKAKNDARVERLLAELSDEERAILVDQIREQSVYGLSDDGEIVRR